MLESYARVEKTKDKRADSSLQVDLTERPAKKKERIIEIPAETKSPDAQVEELT